jgi:plasmid replication initiation protein
VNTKEKIITQSNDLIRALPFKDNNFNISLTQKRILYYFIDEIIHKDYSHRNGDNWIRINTNDLINAINPQKGGNTTLICMNELDKFREGKYKIIINYHDDKGRKVTRHTQWVLEIESIVASGEIDIHFPNLIIENVKNLKGFFTSMTMESIMKAKSGNQIRLYEILLSFSSLGKASFSPNELKKRLDMPSTSYTKFAHFVKRVLEPCCSYINNQNKISVKYDVERDLHNRPEKIVFNIKELTPSKNKITKKVDHNKAKINKLISTNSTYWEEYQFNYRDLYPYADGVRKKNGDEIRYSNTDFINLIEPFLKDDEDEVMDNIKDQIDFEANLAERRGEIPLDRREAPYKIIRGLGGTSEKRSNYGMRDEDDKV